jgi:Fe-S cluster assembly protein SufD
MSAAVKIQSTPVSAGSWVERALQAATASQSAVTSASLAKLIAEARAVWSKLSFPSQKLEDWKYTNPDSIVQGPYEFGVGGQVSSAAKELLERARVSNLAACCEVVFVDGAYSAELSRIEPATGVTVARASETTSSIGSLGLHKEESFAALSTALFSDCVCVTVKKGSLVEAPIHVVHVTTDSSAGRVSTPRLRIDAEEATQITVVESHVGAPGTRYLSLPVGEVVAEKGAVVDYYRIQLESEEASHVSGLSVEQHRDAVVRAHIFSFGGALVRNNAHMVLNGAGAQSVINGLSLLSDSQHVDNTTTIHHREPNTESREHFKGIYAKESRGVFSGTIVVDKIAQKTNAFQSNQALLLSSNASIDSRPQLKIWADDVKCTHGATVGQLDADAMFYLQSRGISKHDARAFLVHAFASEVLTSVQCAPVKEYVETLVSERLAAPQID